MPAKSLCGTRFHIVQILDEDPRTGQELVALNCNAPHHISGLKRQGLVYGIKQKRSWGACVFALTKKGKRFFHATNNFRGQV